MNIRDLVINHMKLNRESILDLMNKNNGKYYMELPVLINSTNGKDLIITNIRTSEEYKIPLVMIYVFISLNMNEVLYNPGEVNSKYDSLSVILSSISKNYSDPLHNGVYYWNEVGIRLLNLINTLSLETRVLRSDIYNFLGIIPDYIRYSKIGEYEFY